MWSENIELVDELSLCLIAGTLIMFYKQRFLPLVKFRKYLSNRLVFFPKNKQQNAPKLAFSASITELLIKNSNTSR